MLSLKAAMLLKIDINFKVIVAFVGFLGNVFAVAGLVLSLLFNYKVNSLIEACCEFFKILAIKEYLVLLE